MTLTKEQALTYIKQLYHYFEVHEKNLKPIIEGSEVLYDIEDVLDLLEDEIKEREQ